MNQWRYIYNKVWPAVCGAAMLLASCDDPRTFDRFEHTDAADWSTDEPVVFAVPHQSPGTYALDVMLRSTLACPYQTVTLLVETTTLPRHSVRRDTVVCTVNDSQGHPAGQAGLSSNETTHRAATLTLARGDSLQVAVRHLMRREELPGIRDVGIRLTRQ